MIKEKITALVKKEEKPNKKKIENLVFAIILLIITLFVINNVFSGDKKKTISNTTIPKEVEQVAQTRDIEKELESALGKIKGVEDVLKRSIFGSFVPLLALNGVMVFILSTENTLIIKR